MRLVIKTDERGFSANQDDYLHGIEFTGASEVIELIQGLGSYACKILDKKLPGEGDPHRQQDTMLGILQSPKGTDFRVDYTLLIAGASIAYRVVRLQEQLAAKLKADVPEDQLYVPLTSPTMTTHLPQ